MKSYIVLLIVFFAGLLPAAAQEGNLIDGCVRDYAADLDYFPDKAEIVDAVNFSVEYFRHYKVVTVADAFDGAPGFN